MSRVTDLKISITTSEIFTLPPFEYLEDNEEYWKLLYGDYFEENFGADRSYVDGRTFTIELDGVCDTAYDDTVKDLKKIHRKYGARHLVVIGYDDGGNIVKKWDSATPKANQNVPLQDWAKTEAIRLIGGIINNQIIIEGVAESLRIAYLDGISDAAETAEDYKGLYSDADDALDGLATDLRLKKRKDT